MNALFLAGGMGKRLKPLTDMSPKPMVPIMGKPLLQRNIEKLSDYGIKDIILSVCYKAESIEEYFGNGRKFGLNIRYAYESKPLGTGGAIKNSEQFLEDTFLVFNADIMCNIDYGKMLKYHKQKGADVTIAVTWVEDPTAYGVIEYDKDKYALTFTEKPKANEVKSHFINAGVYIFEKSALNAIPAEKNVSVERETFPNLLASGKKIAIYDGCKYWLDIGTPEKYMQAQFDIFGGKYPIDEADFSKKKVYKSRSAHINSGADIRGPVYLGENVEIELGASIGPNVVLGDNSIVGKNCKIANSVIWGGVTVASGANMLGTVVADDDCVVDEVSPLMYT